MKKQNRKIHSKCYHIPCKMLGEGNLIFCVRVVRRITSGRSVGQIIIIMIILSFRVGTSKSKNVDHRVKETCAIRSTQVTYETAYISLLRDSTMSNVLNLFFIYHIRNIINNKKRNFYMGNHYYYFDLPKIRVGRARTTKNKVAFALYESLKNCLILYPWSYNFRIQC